MNSDFDLRDVASMQAPSLFIVCQCRSILSWKCRYGADSSILMCSLAALVLNSKQSKTLPLSIRTATSSVLYSLWYSEPQVLEEVTRDLPGRLFAPDDVKQVGAFVYSTEDVGPSCHGCRHRSSTTRPTRLALLSSWARCCAGVRVGLGPLALNIKQM